MKPVTIFKYSFLLILPSVLVSFAVNSVVFISASLIAITHLKTNYPPGFLKKYAWFSTFIISICLALILDVLNQQSFDSRQLTKRLAFVLMPFLIIYSTKNHQKLALKVLVYFMSLLSAGLILLALIRSWVNKGEITYGNWDSDTTEKFYDQEMLLNWGELSYKRIFFFLDMHPSYYAFFSAIVLLILLFTSIVKLKKGLQFTLLFLHSVMILLVSSKAGIICLLLIILIKFFHGKNLKKMFLGLVIFCLIIASALSIPSTRLRVESTYKQVFQSKETETNKRLERLVLWASIKEFTAIELFTGIGITNSKQKIKLLTGVDKNLHNQFLQSLVSSGLIGLLLLLGFIVLPVFYNKNVFTYAFIALLLINLLLENMMDRIWGIMIISFFYSLFVFGDRSLFNKNTDHAPI